MGGCRMAAKIQQGTIKEVEVVHRKTLSTFDGYQRYARIVVWATTENGKHVWVRTVEGGLDPLNIGIKVAMAQEFFSKLVGKKIRFHKDYDGENVFFAEQDSLPKKYLASYQEIKKVMWKWVQTKHAGELEDLCKKRSAKAAATRKVNAEADEASRKRCSIELGLPNDSSWALINRVAEKDRKEREEARQAQDELRRSNELEERRKNALHLAFRKGYNPKRGNEQWEAHADGRKFVLRREDSYNPSEAAIPVEEVFDLVPGRITLVQRI
ncbi:MAG: hypothetical protein UX72_C0009G0018 [Parcubacteria group bacterium GW2011_GWA2_47_10]|nr:MAG: hypothetical protein UX72_C0009G0018 [Parcubacteria group bacterium GW2011_GWA2_47_10]